MPGKLSKMKKADLKQAKIGFPKKKVLPTFIKNSNKDTTGNGTDTVKPLNAKKDGDNSLTKDKKKKVEVKKSDTKNVSELDKNLLLTKEKKTVEIKKEDNITSDKLLTKEKKKVDIKKSDSIAVARSEDSKETKNNGRIQPKIKSGLKEKEKPVEISSDEELPLKVVKDIGPLTKSENDNKSPNKMKTALESGKEVVTLEFSFDLKSQHNQPMNKQNGSVPAMKNLTAVTPGRVVKPISTSTSRSIVIAIDMEPEKWKKLTPQQQMKIIEEKKQVARKHLLKQNIIKDNKKLNIPKFPNKSPLHILPTITKSNLSVLPSGNISNNRPIHPSSALKTTTNAVPTQQFTQLYAPKVDEWQLSNLTPLPTPKFIPLLGFPSKCMGDVLMIVEFVNAFKKLLKSEENRDIYPAELMNALMDGDCVFIVSTILLQFLKVLLGNENYKIIGLRMELADLPLTEFTVSYLTQQFIKSQVEKKKKLLKLEEITNQMKKNKEKQDLGEDVSEDDDDDDDDYKLYGKKNKKKKQDFFPQGSVEFKLNRIVRELETTEFYKLASGDQLTVLKYMLELVLDSQDFQDFFEEIETEKSEVSKKLDQCRIDRFKFQKQLQEKKFLESCVKKDEAASEKPEEKPLIEKVGLTQRQLDAIKQEEEKELQKKKEIEKEELDKWKRLEDEGINKLKQLRELLERCSGIRPLGCDRLKRQYFLFPSGIPGLLVRSCHDMSTFCQPISAGRWDYFEDISEIDKLIAGLTPRGMNEDALQKVLRRNYYKIVASYKVMNRWKVTKPVVKDLSKNVKTDISNATPNNTKDSSEKPIDKDNKTNPILISDSNDSNKSDVKKTNDSDKSDSTKESDSSSTKEIDNSPTTKIDDDSTTKTEKDSTEKLENTEKSESKDSTSILTTTSNLNNESAQSVTATQLPSKDITDEKKSMEVESLQALKVDIIESAQRIIHGSLGDLQEFESWLERLQAADKSTFITIHVMEKHVCAIPQEKVLLKDVDVIKVQKDFILQIRSCIHPKFLAAPFDSATMDITAEWCRAVTASSTLSKLHTLFGVLENSILWERSAEKVDTLAQQICDDAQEKGLFQDINVKTQRCKVCRKMKGSYDYDHIILCDVCFNGYHMYCIKPPVTEQSSEKWTCPKCMPAPERKARKNNVNYNEKALEEEASSTSNTLDTSQDVDSSHEDLCHICETDGLMILCDTCPLSYHLECHNPPLRRTPRGAWSCFECRVPRKKRKYTRKAGKTSSTESDVSENSEEDDDDDDDDDGSQNSEIDEITTKKKSKKRGPKPRKQKQKESDDNDDGSDNSEMDEETTKKKPKKRGPKPRKQKQKGSEGFSDTDNTESDVPKKKKKNSKKRKLVDNEQENSDEDFEEVSKVKKRKYSDTNSSDDSSSTSRKKKSTTKAKNNTKTKKATTTSKSKNSKNSKESKVSWDTSEQKTSLLGNRRPKYMKDSSEGRKSGRSRKQAGSSAEVNASRKILQLLKKHKDAASFLDPVDIDEVPDYLDYVKTPMDISTIFSKMENNNYEDILEIMNDIKLIFENAEAYNQDGSSVSDAAKSLQGYFEELLKEQLPEVYDMIKTS